MLEINKRWREKKIEEERKGERQGKKDRDGGIV